MMIDNIQYLLSRCFGFGPAKKNKIDDLSKAKTWRQLSSLYKYPKFQSVLVG